MTTIMRQLLEMQARGGPALRFANAVISMSEQPVAYYASVLEQYNMIGELDEEQDAAAWWLALLMENGNDAARAALEGITSYRGGEWARRRLRDGAVFYHHMGWKELMEDGERAATARREWLRAQYEEQYGFRLPEEPARGRKRRA